MADDLSTWKLVYAERERLADLFATFDDDQWATMSLCRGWSVQMCAAHIMTSGEQTSLRFIRQLVANGFRFNVMIDKTAIKLGRLDTAEIIERIRARTATTNKAPAPVVAMLGEAVVHGLDIRTPLNLVDDIDPVAKIACLNNFIGSNFPIPARRFVDGLSLHATDLDWKHGTGPGVSGSSQSLLLAVTGRTMGLRSLSGEGLDTLTQRVNQHAMS